MKTDLRIQYTKRAIRETFMKLLKDIPVEKITVTDICHGAGINRATFYRYYDNQYDLLAGIGNEMLEEIKVSTMSNSEDIDTLTRQIFQLFFERKEEWTLLLSDHADVRLQTKIYHFFDEYFMMRQYSAEGQMRYRFMLHGCSGLFEYWVQNGMKETPEQMAGYVTKFRHDLISGSRVINDGVS